ncbi:MAG: phosphatidylserine/phosphatidylglycerophosphate/cardiolipin synthase family protein [Deltaproteobacteria bacterium]|nr:phosphatidylserine/phosphatidylglycerophosphate/cardiolipin synthase family protein [Deltaproteobacteria bacterium]
MQRRTPRRRPLFAGGRRAQRVKHQMLPVGLPAPLGHASNPVDGATLRVLGSGDPAFQRILERVKSAERSVEIRAFLWRDDEAGNQMGEAVLAAADRGAKVTIHKDKIAAVYEYTGGNKQSFFHKRVDPIRGFQAWFLGAVYRAPGSFKQRPNALSERILEHPNIDVQHHRKRFDHSKVYIIDDRYLILGSMGVGDNHRHDWYDVMVEIDGADHIERLRERMAGHDEFDPSRGVDFLVHSREAHRKNTCPMMSHRLALIDSAQVSLTVEMAYMNDRRFTAALARAVQRGIDVKLVTADQADVLANINRYTCDALMRLTGAPDNLTIVLLPRMVHSKVVVIDHRFSDVGSANFTSLSHGVYDEINLYADSESFALSLEAEIASHCAGARIADQRLTYRKMYSGLERAIIAYQSRRGG